MTSHMRMHVSPHLQHSVIYKKPDFAIVMGRG
ncbi:hypothetical protein FOCG_09796 [Fusarium oxysporum f. sp. radicis-lycopersici 26381]|uniref:Uncharacterized protein n=2 Tax=Fusarium oxysporum TaxID=5507 RepID=A0A0J9U4T8_FUSO4|nr:hypothetical protein FOXG_17858 [Fusarium oxysporum f. sp. lycopersici 4287]EXK47744.1 hypothetical protein FOMG_01002 [Fusarium oxysporum f. sp. melonis 26406]EXL49436.1 hypothetical protein FOCG_09796 [Fusarium oxysporum f. sp. radicis-lycopersici 26381]KAI8418810.1 hypothetical protein FOFC_01381 [Fusarium oxysporum]KNA94138.1 hypothetical protein FOXG_17858 [Fusarium oxysporum f. sp. lycopersici 4287]